MTPEECVAAGGHCLVDTGITLTSYPPQYVYRCKHCNVQRRAMDQPRLRWLDDPQGPNNICTEKP